MVTKERAPTEVSYIVSRYKQDVTGIVAAAYARTSKITVRASHKHHTGTTDRSQLMIKMQHTGILKAPKAHHCSSAHMKKCSF